MQSDLMREVKTPPPPSSPVLRQNPTPKTPEVFRRTLGAAAPIDAPRSRQFMSVPSAEPVEETWSPISESEIDALAGPDARAKLKLVQRSLRAERAQTSSQARRAAHWRLQYNMLFAEHTFQHDRSAVQASLTDQERSLLVQRHDRALSELDDMRRRHRKAKRKCLELAGDVERLATCIDHLQRQINDRADTTPRSTSRTLEEEETDDDDSLDHKSRSPPFNSATLESRTRDPIDPVRPAIPYGRLRRLSALEASAPSSGPRSARSESVLHSGVFSPHSSPPQSVPPLNMHSGGPQHQTNDRGDVFGGPLPSASTSHAWPTSATGAIDDVDGVTGPGRRARPADRRARASGTLDNGGLLALSDAAVAELAAASSRGSVTSSDSCASPDSSRDISLSPPVSQPIAVGSHELANATHHEASVKRQSPTEDAAASDISNDDVRQAKRPRPKRMANAI
ncbi:hypothetical protein PYCC9005_003582 [Savitreella phatthalungensis]